MNGKIYIVTCRTTGKQYVGQTKRDMKIRMQHHFQLSKRLTEYPMYADMCKYPDTDFSYEILHEGITDKAELNRLEREEIEKQGTLEPTGYNQPHCKRRVYKKGEEHPSFGKPRSTATKRKIAKARRGQRHSPETIAKIREGVLRARQEKPCSI